MAAASHVTIQALLDTSDVTKGVKDINSGIDNLESSTEKSSGKIATALSAVGKVAATAAAAVVAGVVTIGKQALDAYADYEQLVGGVETLFGAGGLSLEEYAASVGKTVEDCKSDYDSLISAQESMLDKASKAFQTAGLSANDYMEQATSFAASLISSLGGDTTAAVEMVDLAMVDMADNANKMGTDIESIQNAYQGFAKQNYTMLDNLKLGYGGTKTEMERLIADANKLKEAQGEVGDLTIDSYADIIEAIHLVQDEMGITGTTAKEAATTITGSISMAKAAWENFLVGLADEDADFTQLTEDLLDSIGAVAKNVAPRVAQIGAGIIEAFPTVLAGLADVLAPIVSTALATAWDVAAQAVAAIGIDLPDLDASDILSAFDAIAEAAEDLGEAVAPILETFSDMASTLVETLGPPLADLGDSLMPVLTAAIEAASPVVDALLEGLEGLATTIGETVAPVLETLSDFFNDSLPLWQAIFETTFGAIQTTVEIAFGFIQTTVEEVMQVIQDVIQLVMDAINGDWEAVWTDIATLAEDIWTALSDFIGGALQGIVDSLTAFGEGIHEAWETLWQGISDFADYTWDIISSTVSSAIDSVKSTISSTVSGIASDWSNSWNNIKQAASNAWDNIKSSVKEKFDSVVDTIKQLPSKITSAFSNAGSLLFSAGQQIIQGLINGITNMISSAVSAVTNAVSSVVSSAKKFLGIASPSKVFAEIGEYLDEGLSVGIEAKADLPVEQMEELSDMVANVGFEDVSLGVSAATASANGSKYTFEATGTADGLSGRLDDILDELVRLADMGFIINLDGTAIARGIAEESDRISGQRQNWAVRGLAT